MKTKFKITWNTKNLKENGYKVHDVSKYLSEFDCIVELVEGGSIIISTDKSSQGLYQELRRIFGIEFNFFNV